MADVTTINLAAFWVAGQRIKDGRFTVKSTRLWDEPDHARAE